MLFLKLFLGRRRFGFMRGCLSDIIHFNRTAIRIYDYAAKSSSIMDYSSNQQKDRNLINSFTFCTFVRLRDLFVSSERYAFEKGDQVELCTCIKSLCNNSTTNIRAIYLYLMTFIILLLNSGLKL